MSNRRAEWPFRRPDGARRLFTEANAWTDEEKDKYEHFFQKRRRMEDIERKNIDVLITRGSGVPVQY